MIPLKVWLIDVDTQQRFQVVEVGQETAVIIEERNGRVQRVVNKLMLEGQLQRREVIPL